MKLHKDVATEIEFMTAYKLLGDDVTDQVMSILSVGTKEDRRVLDTFNGGSDVRVYFITKVDADSRYTIISDKKVFLYQINAISKAMGSRYINSGKVIESNGRWLEWCDYVHGRKSLEELTEGLAKESAQSAKENEVKMTKTFMTVDTYIEATNEDDILELCDIAYDRVITTCYVDEVHIFTPEYNNFVKLFNSTVGMTQLPRNNERPVTNLSEIIESNLSLFREYADREWSHVPESDEDFIDEMIRNIDLYLMGYVGESDYVVLCDLFKRLKVRSWRENA